MPRWKGAAACCLNDQGQILMVLQGKPNEEKKWSVPSGGIEPGETPEECCVREVWEETGYKIQVTHKLFEKRGKSYGLDIEVHYFAAKVIGGSPSIQDPDRLIHQVAWKSADEIATLNLSFPEDREFLIELARNLIPGSP
jgi:8-oxo-dGTP pyrophosphatase MutT (NUDIX family)